MIVNQIKAPLANHQSYEKMARAKRNDEYLAMLDKSREEIKQGKVVVKSLEELEAMADERCR